MLTNTISQTFQKTKTGLSIAPRNKKQCLLIVFGALERMSALCDVLQSAEVDITCCHSIAEVGVIAAHKYDLVIVDVSSTEIVKVLRIVRNREIEASIPVLVESGRLRADFATGQCRTVRIEVGSAGGKSNRLGENAGLRNQS